MKIKTLLTIFFLMILIAGMNVVSGAQTDPAEKPQTDQHHKDEDDDDDEKEEVEKVSSEERRQVKITPEQARRTALARVAGRIVEEELEKERGVIVYSIEIRDEKGKVFDVEIDAMTGAVVRVEKEDDDDDDHDDDSDDRKLPVH